MTAAEHVQQQRRPYETLQHTREPRPATGWQPPAAPCAPLSLDPSPEGLCASEAVAPRPRPTGGTCISWSTCVNEWVGWFDWLMIDWLVGWLVGWLFGWLIDWLVGWLIDQWSDWNGWILDWSIDWLVGLMDWLTDRLINRLMNWLVGSWIDWLVDELTGWLVDGWLVDWWADLII